MHWRFFIFVILFASTMAQSSTNVLKKKRTKTGRPKVPAVCPDTCALKRRIGKVELQFQEDVTEVKSACQREIGDLREEISGGNLTSPTSALSFAISGSSNGTPSNHTMDLKVAINEALQQLRGEMEDGQTKMNEALEKMRELASTISSPEPDLSLVDSRQREMDMATTINLMNRTLHTIQAQNMNLQRQTQAVRSQSSVLRAQNDILSEDNRALRRQRQIQKLSAKDDLRIEEIENTLSTQVASIKSIEQQMEWLSNRISTLSDGVDSAAYEAASATEAARQAEEKASQALNAARRNPSVVADKATPTQLPQPDIPPSDCWELYQMGYNKSGVYRIRPWNSDLTFKVFCEQAYNGGGWTMIQKRRDGSIDFDVGWEKYAQGFGDLEGEMWLGNDKIHAITVQEAYVLHVLLLDWDGQRAYAEYEGFRVQNRIDYYNLVFGRYTHGTAGDGFRGTVDDGSRNLYLARFTTHDMDNDSCRPCISGDTPFENCASLQGGGWWFRACSDSNLNGRYVHQRDFADCRDACYGIQWRTWRGDPQHSLKASIMLIKPITRQ